MLLRGGDEHHRNLPTERAAPLPERRRAALVGRRHTMHQTLVVALDADVHVPKGYLHKDEMTETHVQTAERRKRTTLYVVGGVAATLVTGALLLFAISFFWPRLKQ